MALTKVTGQVIKNTTDVTVGVLTVTNTLAVGGTVSIGGTLTYEDVTNVDAVGLITARDGIVVGSGITLSVDGDIFATGVTTVSGRIDVISSENTLGILTSTDDGANLDLFDNDTHSRIRTVDGRLQLYSDFLNNKADSAIRFFVDGGNEVARVSPSGVGVGTTNPSASLEVHDGALKIDRNDGSGTSNPHLDLRTGSNLARFMIYASDYNDENSNWNFKTNANEEMSFQIATTEALRIDSSANVGIGTSIIGGKLHLHARTGDCKLIIEADKFQDQGSEANNPYILFRQDAGQDMSAVGNNLYDSGSDHNALYLANSAGAGGIIFATGTTTGYTNATERARFTNSGGELLVGIKTSRSMNNKESVIQVEGASAEGSSIRIYRNQSNQNAPTLDFGKSRGSGVLSNTLVQNGDTIGTINWNAADGTDSESRTAHIRSEVDGTAAANDTPGRLIFSTTSSGTGSPSERLRINSSGHLIFDGDTNTYIHRPASDTFAFVNGGNETCRLHSTGRLLFGHTTSLSTSSVTSILQIIGDSNNTSSLSVSRYTDNANGNFILLAKSRGTSPGSYTAVQSGDTIGSLRWCGSDGTDMAESVAEIRAEVDGSVSSNVIPGRLIFKTSRAGTLVEAMRIADSGHIGINNTAPDQELDIKAINQDATLRLTAAEDSDATIELYADEADDNVDRHRIAAYGDDTGTGGLRFQNYASGAWISTLILTGDTTGNDLCQTKVANGSASVPSLSFIDDADTGLYRIGSNTIGMTHAGNHRHRFESDGDVVFGGNTLEGAQALSIMPNQSQGAARITFARTARSNTSLVVKFMDGSDQVGDISYNATAVDFDTDSDYRLKFNDTEITDGIERLKKLRPIRFNWKKEPTTRVDGFFAHEVSPVVPNAIRGEKDKVVTQQDIDSGEASSTHDKIGDPMYQTIDHSKLVPLLTAALKEEILKREEEVNALKERLARAGLW